MAATPKTDDELLDAYYADVLPPGFTRGVHAKRLAAREPAVRTSGAADPVTRFRERVERFKAQVQREMLPVLAESAVSIFLPDNDQPVQHGTGTLFRVAGTLFLVTASHVVDAQTKGDQTLHVGGRTPGSSLVPLRGELVQEPKLDVAVVALSAETASALTGFRPLSVHQADRRGERPAEGWFTVYGFPRCFATTDPVARVVECQPYQYSTFVYQGRTGHLDDGESLDPDIHLLLDASPLRSRDADGNPADLPRLNGISGCAVWQTFYPGQRIDGWTTDDARVVGVQTHVYSKTGIIRGTRWWVVEDIIRRGWPHLAPALSRDVPDPHPAGAG